MFTIVPLAPRNADDFAPWAKQTRPQTEDGEMDIDENFAGPSRITSPGEAIASSTAVLRCASPHNICKRDISDAAVNETSI